MLNKIIDVKAAHLFFRASNLSVLILPSGAMVATECVHGSGVSCLHFVQLHSAILRATQITDKASYFPRTSDVDEARKTGFIHSFTHACMHKNSTLQSFNSFQNTNQEADLVAGVCP